MGHNGYVDASDMMRNYQHKNHICKACHNNIVKIKADEKKAEVSSRIADIHKRAEKEVDALMGTPLKKQKLKGNSMMVHIDHVLENMKLNRELGYE